jgi:hypothetical protein
MAYEADLEKWCREQATKAGGYLLKWVSPGNKGVPDRILMMPGFIVFIEFKALKKRLDPLQAVWRARIVGMDLDHAIVRTKDEFMRILASCK